MIRDECFCWVTMLMEAGHAEDRVHVREWRYGQMSLKSGD